MDRLTSVKWVYNNVKSPFVIYFDWINGDPFTGTYEFHSHALFFENTNYTSSKIDFKINNKSSFYNMIYTGNDRKAIDYSVYEDYNSNDDVVVKIDDINNVNMDLDEFIASLWDVDLEFILDNGHIYLDLLTDYFVSARNQNSEQIKIVKYRLAQVVKDTIDLDENADPGESAMMTDYIWYVTNAIQFNILNDTYQLVNTGILNEMRILAQQLEDAIISLKPIITPYYYEEPIPYIETLPADVINLISNRSNTSALSTVNKQFQSII